MLEMIFVCLTVDQDVEEVDTDELVEVESEDLVRHIHETAGTILRPKRGWGNSLNPYFVLKAVGGMTSASRQTWW